MAKGVDERALQSFRSSKSEKINEPYFGGSKIEELKYGRFIVEEKSGIGVEYGTY